MKDRIKDKKGLNVLMHHSGVEEPSRIFCDEIEYMHNKGKFEGHPIFDHHLMFWNKRELVFKVWLKNNLKNKEFKNINEALKSVNIKVIK